MVIIIGPHFIETVLVKKRNLWCYVGERHLNISVNLVTGNESKHLEGLVKSHFMGIGLVLVCFQRLELIPVEEKIFKTLLNILASSWRQSLW